MGKVEAFQIEGLDLWFNSSDHLPPHIHVRQRGHWEIRVFFLECTVESLAATLKWGSQAPSAQQRKKILAAVLRHREELLLEWERKVCTK